MTTSEAALIQRLRRTSAGSRNRASRQPGITLGIGDDAALFRPRRGHEIVLTCDWFLEGTHFLRDKHPADSVGWKSLARAVSDIAAMGAEPRSFLLSLALPESLTGRWLDQFLSGLRRAARKLHCPLAGGDTTRQSKVLINITVVGEVPANRAVLRSGARPGDLIYVSGRLGQAELGLHLLRGKPKIPNLSPAAKNAALKKHLYPEPRIVLARWLADRNLANSMMDLSDGLSTDLPRLCAASQVGALLDASQIPTAQFPKWNRAGKAHALPVLKINALGLALNGGDDYELLFTVSPTKSSRIPAQFQGHPLTAIGKITRNRAQILSHAGGRTQLLQPAGWDPFRP
jgi:thiamine-monophosphate kinase